MADFLAEKQLRKRPVQKNIWGEPMAKEGLDIYFQKEYYRAMGHSMSHGKNEYLPLRILSDFAKGRRGREEAHVHPSERCSSRNQYDRRRTWQNDQNSLAHLSKQGSTSGYSRPGTSS